MRRSREGQGASGEAGGGLSADVSPPLCHAEGMAIFKDSDAHARIDALTQRVASLEAMVQFLANREGITLPELQDVRDSADPGLTAEVRRLADEGKMIHAIKEYRTATGAGLREAKDAVDAYAQRGRSW